MGKIFAGLIFVFFHVRINGLDLLPDFVGYLLIYFGMSAFGQAERRCEVFWKSRGFALAAAILEVVTFVMALLWGDMEAVSILLLAPVGLVLQLVLTFRIMQGVGELEQTLGLDLNGASLERAWKVMAGLIVAGYLLAWLAQVLGDIVALLAGACGVAGLVCAVWYIVVFYRAWRAWERGT